MPVMLAEMMARIRAEIGSLIPRLGASSWPMKGPRARKSRRSPRSCDRRTLNRRLAAPSWPVAAVSLESPSAAGGDPRRTASRPPFLGGDHEGDPLGGVGTRALRPCERAGREGRPGRDVEVRVRDRRPEADVQT